MSTTSARKLRSTFLIGWSYCQDDPTADDVGTLIKTQFTPLNMSKSDAEGSRINLDEVKAVATLRRALEEAR